VKRFVPGLTGGLTSDAREVVKTTQSIPLEHAPRIPTTG